MKQKHQDLIRGILSGDREPVNREESRAWERYTRNQERRERRARARTQAVLNRYPKEALA